MCVYGASGRSKDVREKKIEIAVILKITKESVGHIVLKRLGILTLCAKWVSSELTIDRFSVLQIFENADEMA